MRPDRLRFSTLRPLAAALCMAALPGAALGQDCSPPKQPAKAHLELRHGNLQLLHDLDTAGIRGIVNGVQGYVAGPWHLPIGLTLAEFDTRFETSFYFREAQPFGYCVALAEAKVSLGYEDVTVYVSSEYPEGSCEYDTILAHEQEHVRINREILKTYKPKLQQAFARVLRSKKVMFARRKDEARSAYLLELRHQFKQVVTEMLNARNLKNGAIDTQDNYRRLMAQCDGWRLSAGPTSGVEAHAEPASAAESVEVAQTAPPAATETPDDLAPGSAQNGSGGEVIELAQSETAELSPKSESDPAHFVRQGTETVDHFRREGVDFRPVHQVRDAAVQVKPDVQVRDISFGDQHRAADRDLRRPVLFRCRDGAAAAGCRHRFLQHLLIQLDADLADMA